MTCHVMVFLLLYHWPKEDNFNNKDYLWSNNCSFIIVNFLIYIFDLRVRCWNIQDLYLMTIKVACIKLIPIKILHSRHHLRHHVFVVKSSCIFFTSEKKYLIECLTSLFGS